MTPGIWGGGGEGGKCCGWALHVVVAGAGQRTVVLLEARGHRQH